ncbi:MAG: hypothetical protein DME75_00165 [Verrucomicrobia bacterium]|nr:MAG: hypothetical protein DME75_00165 [Verrucomicrobiota bacterium]
MLVCFKHVAGLIVNAIDSSDSSCAVRQQGISHFSGYDQRENRHKNDTPLGTVEIRLELGLKKSMTI